MRFSKLKFSSVNWLIFPIDLTIKVNNMLMKVSMRKFSNVLNALLATYAPVNSFSQTCGKMTNA